MAPLGDVLSTIPATELMYRANDMQEVSDRARFRRYWNLINELKDTGNLSSKSKIILRAFKYHPKELFQARMFVHGELKAARARATREQYNLRRRQSRAAAAAAAKAKAKPKAKPKAKAKAKAKAAA